MSLPAKRSNRRVLPRWRDTQAAAETGEMKGLKRVTETERVRAQQGVAQQITTALAAYDANLRQNAHTYVQESNANFRRRG